MSRASVSCGEVAVGVLSRAAFLVVGLVPAQLVAEPEHPSLWCPEAVG